MSKKFVPKKSKYLLEVQLSSQHHIDLLITIRHLCELTQQEVADGLAIDRCTLTKYENRQQEMSITRFIDICNFYQQYIIAHGIQISEKAIELNKLCQYFPQEKVYL